MTGFTVAQDNKASVRTATIRLIQYPILTNEHIDCN